MAKEKVVLAYSGGLDTSIIIPWLKENYDCEVIAVAADVGQGEELEPLREKAIATGASKIYIEDLRKEFVEDYIFPTVKAGAVVTSVTDMYLCYELQSTSTAPMVLAPAWCVVTDTAKYYVNCFTGAVSQG